MRRGVQSNRRRHSPPAPAPSIRCVVVRSDRSALGGASLADVYQIMIEAVTRPIWSRRSINLWRDGNVEVAECGWRCTMQKMYCTFRRTRTPPLTPTRAPSLNAHSSLASLHQRPLHSVCSLVIREDSTGGRGGGRGRVEERIEAECRKQEQKSAPPTLYLLARLALFSALGNDHNIPHASALSPLRPGLWALRAQLHRQLIPRASSLTALEASDSSRTSIARTHSLALECHSFSSPVASACFSWAPSRIHRQIYECPFTVLIHERVYEYLTRRFSAPRQQFRG